MNFGFGIPIRGPLANMESISEIVKGGEELGFNIVTVSDHIVVPHSIKSTYPYNESGEFAGQEEGGACLEQLTTLMAIASVTKNIRLLTSVMVLPHRSPIMTAKILATIDVLSKGRLTLGCGVGWMREEFEAISAPNFDERGQVGSEYLKIFKELWTNENPSFSGDYESFNNIFFAPKPVQKPHPPIWVGGESAPALKRAASLGDCWYPIGSNPRFPLDNRDRLQARISRLHGFAEEFGRDPNEIDLAYSASWFETSPNQKREKWFIGSPDEVTEDIAQIKELGVNHLVLSFPGTSTSEILDKMSYFSDKVMPQFK